jgi:hypothetical protein
VDHRPTDPVPERALGGSTSPSAPEQSPSCLSHLPASHESGAKSTGVAQPESLTEKAFGPIRTRKRRRVALFCLAAPGIAVAGFLYCRAETESQLRTWLNHFQAVHQTASGVLIFETELGVLMLDAASWRGDSIRLENPASEP